MAKVILKRSGRSVTMSDKLARALVKGGRYDYARSDMEAEPVAPVVAPVEPESADIQESQAAASTEQARTKRAYKRRDMKAD
jgi:hypothetical protein